MAHRYSEMEKEAMRAAKELTTAHVGCIAYCCTASKTFYHIDVHEAIPGVGRLLAEGL
jgi:maleate cis-trans isomerase